MNNFPYPVLTENKSSYVDDIHFIIECKKYFVENSNIKIEIIFDLNSEYLKSLISANNAKVVLNISTSIINSHFEIIDLNEKFVCTLPIENIKFNDSITINCLIVTNKIFEIESNKELNELYGEDYKFKSRIGDILAISNKEKLSFYTENNNLIKFKSSADIENGYKIRLSSENFIEVLVREDFIKAYKIVSNNKNISMMLDCNIVYEVLVYTLLQISQDYTELKNKPWFESLSRMFNECGEDLNDFINIITSDSKINIDSIYDICHKLTNNQICNSVIKTSEKIIAGREDN